MSEATLSAAVSLEDPEVFARRQAQLTIANDWFAAKQREAWERYNELPFPTRTSETWRYGEYKAAREIGSYVPAPFAAAQNPELTERSQVISETAGRFVFVDDNLAAARELDSELEKQGVIFTTLLDALNQHPELVEKYLLAQSPELGSEKFEALHIAMLRNGVFLYVPKGVKVEKPFTVYHWSQADGSAIFPHTLLVCDEEAEANLIEFQQSVSAETKALVIANAHVFAENGAKPRHTIVQGWNANTLSFQLNTSNAQAKVESRGIIINAGSALARQEVHGKIFGSDSDVNLYALNAPTGKQVFDQRTLQTHLAPASRSDLLYKNALWDESKTIFSGLIIVGEDAQQTDAYQTNNNLMLSDAAEANSLPGLEIGANDVKCSHGATTGKIDDSNIFYFLARGIPRKKAEELMVLGFLEEIIDKFDNEELASHVRGLMEQKLH
jgi:Fe-S cluster assembly protein SufD